MYRKKMNSNSPELTV